MPDVDVQDVGEFQLASLGYYPEPPILAEVRRIDVYEYPTTAILMLYDKEDMCLFVHVGLT